MNSYQALQTLNLDPDASFDDVKYAYRKLALELHPDKNSDEKEGEKFKSVTAAYHFLKKNHRQGNSSKKSNNTKAEQTF